MDSDYHVPPDKTSRMREAKKNGIDLHIWSKKEIENYLIVLPAILRLIIKKKPQLSQKLTLIKLEESLNLICESLKDELIDDYASEIGKFFRSKNRIIDFTDNYKELSYEMKNINRVARNHVKQNWNHRISILPGKKLLKELNKWLVSNYSVSFGTIELASALKSEELDPEIKNIIIKIDEVKDLNPAI